MSRKELLKELDTLFPGDQLQVLVNNAQNMISSSTSSPVEEEQKKERKKEKKNVHSSLNESNFVVLILNKYWLTFDAKNQPLKLTSISSEFDQTKHSFRVDKEHGNLIPFSLENQDKSKQHNIGLYHLPQDDVVYIGSLKSDVDNRIPVYIEQVFIDDGQSFYFKTRNNKYLITEQQGKMILELLELNKQKQPKSKHQIFLLDSPHPTLSSTKENKRDKKPKKEKQVKEVAFVDTTDYDPPKKIKLGSPPTKKKNQKSSSSSSKRKHREEESSEESMSSSSSSDSESDD